MSGRKPPRPLAQPFVPRQRRPTRPAPEPEPEPAPALRVAPELEEVEDVEPGPPRLLGVVVAGMGVLVLLAATIFLVLRGDDNAPSAGSGNGPAPEPPVELAPRTSYVDTRVTADGDLVVRQWVHGKAALFGVTLAPPPSAGAVQVTDVLVVAGDRIAPGPERLRRGRGSFTFTGTHDVYLTYRVAGAVERSDSAPGRALARFTSLDVDVTPPMLATTYAVSGGDVLALACSPGEPGAVPVPCGAPSGDGWQVEREGDDRDDVVIAQLDLP
ncbi:MAG: hypothetical protein ABWX84_07470 [Nocardioides sp.]